MKKVTKTFEMKITTQLEQGLYIANFFNSNYTVSKVII